METDASEGRLRYAGRRLSEVVPALEAQGIPYVLLRTRPTRSFFKTEEAVPYVVREKRLPDGTIQLVTAAASWAAFPRSAGSRQAIPARAVRRDKESYSGRR
jgi:hypothetical protein